MPAVSGGYFKQSVLQHAQFFCGIENVPLVQGGRSEHAYGVWHNEMQRAVMPGANLNFLSHCYTFALAPLWNAEAVLQYLAGIDKFTLRLLP
jgi:hypothetical protein